MQILACMYINIVQDFIKLLCYTKFILPIFAMVDTTSIYVTTMSIFRILFGLPFIVTKVYYCCHQHLVIRFKFHKLKCLNTNWQSVKPPSKYCVSAHIHMLVLKNCVRISYTINSCLLLLGCGVSVSQIYCTRILICFFKNIMHSLV